MKEVTSLMIDIFELKKLKYDFMGYTFTNSNQLSFHHLIIPKKDCKKAGLGDGYLFWNGAILKQQTSHDYLHIIERLDRNTFLKITNIMIEENKNQKLDLQSLKAIRYLLLQFERQYKGITKKDGKKLIRLNYIKDRIPL